MHQVYRHQRKKKTQNIGKTQQSSVNKIIKMEIIWKDISN
jgi:hypothetical protein